MPHIAVFDTNVLISGIGWKGKPFECLELARAGVVQAVTCEEIVAELTEKLERKLNFSADEIADTQADLLSFLRCITIQGTIKVVEADPDDDKILECALVGQCTHIVTGDRQHLLPLGSFQGIAIVSPAKFVELVAQSS